MPEGLPQARDQAGALMGVSGKYVSEAEKHLAEEAKKRQLATLPEKGQKGFQKAKAIHSPLQTISSQLKKKVSQLRCGNK